MVKFLHSSDWHLGRPFHSLRRDESRFRVRRARLEAVVRMGALAEEHGASFILVSGDLFDSPTPTRETVAEACSAIGGIGIPVYAIPGNHDHGGPAGPWRSAHFQTEREQLAPNLTVLEEPVPVEVEGVLLLPAPLETRHVLTDPTAWIRSVELSSYSADLPRVVLAHGSTTDFTGTSDPDDPLSGAPNLIALDRLPLTELDYVALGDWHGSIQVGEKAWYSGTPEPDRFPRGSDYHPGQALLVEAGRGAPPAVSPVVTAGLEWRTEALSVSGDESVDRLLQELEEITGSRVGQDLLRLRISGTLGLEARSRLEEKLDQLGARMLQLDLDLEELQPLPTRHELEALARRGRDPLVTAVAERLMKKVESGDEGSRVAVGLALTQLYLLVGAEPEQGVERGAAP